MSGPAIVNIVIMLAMGIIGYFTGREKKIMAYESEIIELRSLNSKYILHITQLRSSHGIPPQVPNETGNFQ